MDGSGRRLYPRLEWGEHERQEYFLDTNKTRVSTTCPDACKTGQKQKPGREFLGGHYVSDKYLFRKNITSKVPREARDPENVRSANLSRYYAERITEHYRDSLTCLKSNDFNQNNTLFKYSTNENEQRTNDPWRDENDNRNKNVYCGVDESKVITNFKRFDFKKVKDAHAVAFGP